MTQDQRTCAACIGTNGNHERGCYLAAPSSKTDLAGRIEKYLRCYDEVSGVTCPSHELLREALAALRPAVETTAKPARDADHCDYPDCEQHYSHVVQTALGCFEAALTEGWIDALANGDIERIRDLWTRRISFAQQALTGAYSEKSRETTDHSELLKKLPRVGTDFVAEVQALSRQALEQRVLIQKDWLGSYSRCLDGLGLKIGVESARDPRDIRRIVESMRPEEPTRSTESDCSTGIGGVTLVQMAENMKLGLDPYTGSSEKASGVEHILAAIDRAEKPAAPLCNCVEGECHGPDVAQAYGHLCRAELK
jgi:hypothetical protein